MLPKVEIFEEHHEVLRAWSRYRRTLDFAPWVVTIDHHTDTLPAFGRAAGGDESLRRQLIAAFDWRDDASVERALAAGLRHDEHLDLALRSGLTAGNVILAHYNTATLAHPMMRVAADSTWPPIEVLLNDPERFRPYADQVLERDFLAARLAEAEFNPVDHPGFILDLDLDAFLTRRSLHPVDASLFQALKHSAGLITIAREPLWCHLLSFPEKRK